MRTWVCVVLVGCGGDAGLAEVRSDTPFLGVDVFGERATTERHVLSFDLKGRPGVHIELSKPVGCVDRAVSLVDRALSVGGDRGYVFDTKVRILLKAGRESEAYSIVHTILAEDPARTSRVQPDTWRG